MEKRDPGLSSPNRLDARARKMALKRKKFSKKLQQRSLWRWSARTQLISLVGESQLWKDEQKVFGGKKSCCYLDDPEHAWWEGVEGCLFEAKEQRESFGTFSNFDWKVVEKRRKSGPEAWLFNRLCLSLSLQVFEGCSKVAWGNGLIYPKINLSQTI